MGEFRMDWLERECQRALEADKLKTPSFILDAKGALWRWNCGWWVCAPDGRVIGGPIGHVAFRKVPKPHHTDRAWKYIRRKRDFKRPFRRVPNDANLKFTHWQHGEITVISTDGIYCKCQKLDGSFVQLLFNELNEKRDPRTKQCPECREWNLGLARECSCGYEFPFKQSKRRAKPVVSQAEIDAAINDILGF